MADVIALGIVVVFFALMVLYVRWCDRLVGSSPDDAGDRGARGQVRQLEDEVSA